MRDLAGVIGGKVDILINTAELHRNHTIADRGTETARAEMEVNYLGLMRLAQAFGPAMRARAAEGTGGDRMGEPALDLCALGAAVARHVLGVESGGVRAVAEFARRDAPRRHPRGERVSRPDRRRMESARAAAEARRRRRSRRRSSRRCATASRTSIRATSRRTSSRASARARRCSNASCGTNERPRRTRRPRWRAGACA